MRGRFLSVLVFCFSLQVLFCSGLQAQQRKDSTKYLLLDYALQIEIADAVDFMYNFNFHRAEADFSWLKYRHPEHPLPYFLYGISTWWQMMPNLDADHPELGDEFLAYMDTAIAKAKKLLEFNEDNVEANFFMSGAYGFKGRYHSEKRNWGKAASAGRLALKYLKRIKGSESFSPEILFGDALFNYYSIWIRENYPMLRPILMFFAKGDKALGIKQLEEVANNAFYTRVEAQFFLMRIRAFEEKKNFEALRLVEYVFDKYPNNPYFHRFYARMLYTTGQYEKAEEVSNEILTRIDSSQLGYESVSGRWASFYLGHINRVRGNKAEAKRHYLRTRDFGAETESKDTGYFIYASLHLAEIYMDERQDELATPLIEEIRKNTKRKHPANKRARALRKEIKNRR